MYITKKPERINKLRDYYRNNSKMVTDENVVCWKCHRSLMLYLEGWEKNVCNTDTARIRRSAAESYMLENTKPVIIPGELIVGQPNFEDFTADEQRRYDNYMDKQDMWHLITGFYLIRA